MECNCHLADQLGQVRDEIKKLRTLEKDLRDQFANGANARVGQTHEVIVRSSRRRVFLCDKLPSHILNDPGYWSVKYSKTVVSRPLKKPVPHMPAAQGLRATRPGDPPENCATQHADATSWDDDFDVIERSEAFAASRRA